MMEGLQLDTNVSAIILIANKNFNELYNEILQLLIQSNDFL